MTSLTEVETVRVLKFPLFSQHHVASEVIHIN